MNKVYHPRGGIRLCAYCGKEFNKRAGSKYCSPKCYHKIYYHKPKITKVCVVCGKEFVATREKQRCCGNICRCALYRRKNPERVKKIKQDWFARLHPKRQYSRMCAFCGEGFEALRKSQKYCSMRCNIARYRSSEKHKLIAVMDYHKRREDKTKNDYSARDWHFALEFFRHSCAYCGKKARLHQDHFMPLKLGGSYTRMNIVPACSSCNYKKNAKHPSAFLRSFENKDDILKRINEFFDQMHRRASPVDNWRL